jgi:glycosyltransferase involved in cell wall biosynthesis
MIRPLRVLVVTDSFPPRCGGSGWSTWELVRGLASRGHTVRVVRIALDDTPGPTDSHVDSIPVTSVHVRAPHLPFLRNMIKNEWLWRRLTRSLSADLRRAPVDIIHAQHVMTTVPAIRAGRAAGIPVVATVRDYWPVCYWSDLIYDPDQPRLCGACTVTMMTTCVKPRAGAAFPAAWPLIPYMRANLRAKRTTLARSSAIIAVSTAIARDLVARAPDLARTPLHTIPNPIDMAALDEAAASAVPPLAGPYILYAGKIATNKGTQFLPAALERARITWPIVVVGDGPGRAALEADARARGLDLRVLGWRDRDEVWAWMRHATLLAFPSYGPESLSRVLIEAAALGTPIAAMDTGGTTDILQHGVTGLLASNVEAFARDLAALAGDAALRRRLGDAAREHVHARFDARIVVARVEQVYEELMASQVP